MPVIKRTDAQELMLNNIKTHFPAGPFTREDYKKAMGTRSVPQTKTLAKLVEYGDLICIDEETYRLIAAGEVLELANTSFAVEDKKVSGDAVSALFEVKGIIKSDIDSALHWMERATFATEPNSQKGIYGLYDAITGQLLYVGQTGGKGNGNATFESRWKEHIDQLIKGKHHCEKLQNYFVVSCDSNPAQIQPRIIEELPSNAALIDLRERYYINKYSDILLNTVHPSLIDQNFDVSNYQTVEAQPDKTLKGLEVIARKVASAIHNYLYASVKLSDQDKATLIAGIIIALNKKQFAQSYRNYDDGPDFMDQFMGAIKHSISQYKGLKTGHDAIYAVFDFIAHNENFIKTISNKDKTYIALQFLTEIIEESIVRIAKEYPSYDVMGDFYNEFAKFSGADQQSLGIVLTPHHIADFMSDLLELKPTDKILDVCCGTGALPITAHRFAENQIIGIEYNARMLALCLSNMIMRGYDSILYLGDSYNETLLAEVANQKPTKMIINPPYSQNGYPELGFVKRGLDQLEKGGLGVAIIPMSCAIKNDKATKDLKEAILNEHQLIATFSMPDQLFYPVGIVTCIMVFRAHCPHEDCSFFGYMKDDGFEITRINGRQDTQGKWAGIKKNMLELYKNFDEVAGESIIEEVAYNNEWCCEAYMKTDYSTINNTGFQEQILNYIVFNLKRGFYNL